MTPDARPIRHTAFFDALGLCFLSMLLVAAGLLATKLSQQMAQRPAHQGVLTVHLSSTGDLRLWNQSILPQDLPRLLHRAQERSSLPGSLVVRLIPDGQVPWGVIQGMLTRLQPNREDRRWVLQLQLP